MGRKLEERGGKEIRREGGGKEIRREGRWGGN